MKTTPRTHSIIKKEKMCFKYHRVGNDQLSIFIFQAVRVAPGFKKEWHFYSFVGKRPFIHVICFLRDAIFPSFMKKNKVHINMNFTPFFNTVEPQYLKWRMLRVQLHEVFFR